MKKLTIKLKITIWFTAFMILLSVIVFVFIAVVSSTTTNHRIRGALTSIVDKNIDEVEYDDGELEIDDDFVSFHDGIYCLLFYENGDKISGYVPYLELENESFEDKSIRQVRIGGEIYLIYDRFVTMKRHDDVWIRGVVLESGNSMRSLGIYRATVIALPILIILAAAGGYLIAKSSLQPIQQINETAEEIGKSGDLSKRIEIDDSGDELYQLACAFNRMFDKLEANFEAERHFTSDASHELRTPVSTILAQCEYAFENASGEEELYESIGVIQKQGYRMSRLIESLLHFTRMEQQTQVPSFETIDLSNLTLSVCKEQRENNEKNISLVEDVQSGIKMKADMGLISQMLVNLIRNAYKYGRENGKISVNLKENNNKIILSIADDGVGIAPKEIEKIWNRFYRVDKSRSYSKGAGFGLGLAMVKEIVKLHGGSVYVDSELGKGSVFTVEFKSV